LFHPVVREWFTSGFTHPSRAQALGWAAIARGESTLILAPTGSGKTLAAFLWCLDRLLFTPAPLPARRCRMLYVSPLKALAVDVERNLHAPLEGIAQVAALHRVDVTVPSITVRTGDTPAAERNRFRREPSDILITTPESLYLLLTSSARETLRSVETVIIDEIHALVASKRGAHLALSLERLEAIADRSPQRIGLSATQRPLEEVARFLGGVQTRKTRTGRPAAGARARPAPKADPEDEISAEFSAPAHPTFRPVTVVDAGTKRPLELAVEGIQGDQGSRGAQGAGGSTWSVIHPRLLELIRDHRSTLIFVNSRRLAERLAAALNELAGETLVRSHHGSLAREQRLEVEELLKAGNLRALVATSSLELGIDMGAIDLVVQIEPPPSVSSGLQRIGRGGHRIDAVSTGVIFPKFRGELLSSAAVTRAMHDGAVEAIRYPRNPLDVVAQQVVAMAAMDPWRVDDLLAAIRGAAPFADLSRAAFEGVLDMLSGRYPSDAFAALRPRITWDRRRGIVTAREGARHVAVTNAGTIPDRGLFGVFLAGAPRGAGRVGELDEEMVFESAIGDTFVLGASSWRIEEITHDRVLVSPAPGEPGRMPFWKGERPGRPLELGLAIGRLGRDLLTLSPPAALARLTRDHDLVPAAAEQLLGYLREQQASTRVLPDDSTVIVERVRDDYGDWRICVLSPRGGRVHAPWAIAAAAHIRQIARVEVDTLWTDDGFVVRYPDVDVPPDAALLLPDADEVESLVVRQLGGTALFASRFRENAARSLLLPRRRPGQRAPLWQQRRRAADLLTVASRFGSFPVLLETYRECLRDIFDMPALQSTLADIRRKRIQVVTVDTEKASPFAASLLFGYVASFLYEGDAPLAERRAQALSIDQAQLRELLGSAELRDLLDPGAIEQLARQVQRLDPRLHARSIDGVHDLLLGLGDLSLDEIAARTDAEDVTGIVDALAGSERALAVSIAGHTRLIAVEDASKYRDALGVRLPRNLPEPLLQSAADPSADLVSRFARTHVPFNVEALAERFGMQVADAQLLLDRLTTDGSIVEGAFTPGVTGREWSDPGVLRQLRRRSLANLRHDVEPVEPQVLGRFATTWHGVVSRRQGPDVLLDVIEQLQGVPIALSMLEIDVLPARVAGYEPQHLDTLMAAGEVVWVGLEPVGDRDGRIALFLPSASGDLRSQRPRPSPLHPKQAAILDALAARGASFFGPLHEAIGGGYPAESVATLWELVWAGLVTNDTFHALRAYARPPARPRHRDPAPRPRRLTPPSAEGRWSLVQGSDSDHTSRTAALSRQLLARHGVLTRETMNVEAVDGGFSRVYPVLKAMEDRGQIRRGYFVAGLGAAQFALPAAVDLLRSLREPRQAEAPGEVVVLGAADPANPYGATLRFPAADGRTPGRTIGSSVVLVDGALAAFLHRGDRTLLTWVPAVEPDRSRVALAIARALLDRARAPAPFADAEPGVEPSPRGMLVEEIDGVPAVAHVLTSFFVEAGFRVSALGLQAIY
jgi:ATP-dependent Lhr-like helicase